MLDTKDLLKHAARCSTLADLSQPSEVSQRLVARATIIGWAIAIAVLAAMTWLGFFQQLNADELWSQALLGDLWKGVAPFRWMLPPANGFFPGLLMAAFGFALGLDNVPYYLFFAATFSMLLFLAAGTILWRAGLETSQAWSAAALSVVLMCLINPYKHAIGQMLFLPGSHSGIVPVALFCFALVSRSVETAQPAALSLFALVSLY